MFELYTVIMNGSIIRRWTSNNKDINYLGQTFQAISIDRSEISTDATLSSQSLELTVHKDNSIAQMFTQSAPEERIFLTVDKVVNGLAVQIFYGTITGVDFERKRARIICNDMLSQVDRLGLKYTYQTQCNHEMYDLNCGLLLSNHLSSVTINSIENNGKRLYSNAFVMSSELYTGGVLLLGGRRLNVINHDFVNGFVDLYEATNIIASSNIQIAPGCKNLASWCKQIDNNNFRNNFLGFTHIPNKNPYIEL